ncbi:MAG: hypothetical protein H8Z69_02410 [Nanohaloarchaea archaeon]|nr:hypothetical protein [Candidatus Nanohaloarchaea archaeon]
MPPKSRTALLLTTFILMATFTVAQTASSPKSPADRYESSRVSPGEMDSGESPGDMESRPSSNRSPGDRNNQTSKSTSSTELESPGDRNDELENESTGMESPGDRNDELEQNSPEMESPGDLDDTVEGRDENQSSGTGEGIELPNIDLGRSENQGVSIRSFQIPDVVSEGEIIEACSSIDSTREADVRLYRNDNLVDSAEASGDLCFSISPGAEGVNSFELVVENQGSSDSRTAEIRVLTSGGAESQVEEQAGASTAGAPTSLGFISKALLSVITGGFVVTSLIFS